MKSNVFQSFTFLTAFAILLSACGGLGNMDKRIEELGAKAEPEPLIVRGDSVELKVSGKFPEKYFHKKVIVEATPVLVYEGGEETFKMKGFQGEDAAGNYEVVPNKSGKSFSYTSKVPYRKGMEQSTVELRISGSKGSKNQTFDPLKIGTGVITTPFLVQADDKFLIGKDNFQRVLSYTKNATLNYEYNSSVVRPGELRKTDVKELFDFIAFAAKKDSIILTGTAVDAYASPEGEQSLNENLASDRAKSANATVANEVKRRKIQTTEGFYVDNPKGEDWEGFKTLMEQSNIPDRNLILSVLQMYPDKAKREQEIRNIAKTYQTIERDILPQLRRSQIKLKYDVVGYSDDELRDLSKTNPDILRAEEVLYAATLFEDLRDKLEIYAHAERLFPADYRGANNVGYCLMLQNKMPEAKSKFEKALGIERNPVTLNNLGAIARIESDRKKAAEYLNEATAAGPEVKYNKGLLNIQNGDYSAAITNMGSFNTVNMALAKLLNGDLSGAKTALDNSGDDSGVAHYVHAIIAARMNQGAEVSSSLGKAVEKDPALRARAKKDLEFRNFQSQLNL